MASTNFPTNEFSNAECTRALLDAFHLLAVKDQFVEVLHNSCGFIGGSAALTWFLASRGWPAVIHEDQDLDIFIRMPKDLTTLGMYFDLVCTTYDLLLRSAGYVKQSKAERLAELRARFGTHQMAPLDYTHSHIYKVQNFHHPSGRKIQVVFVRPGLNFLDILSKPDLNLSKFAIFPSLPWGCDTADDALTLVTYAVKKAEVDEIVEGYFRLSNVSNNFVESTIARIVKYYQRGFTMIGKSTCESCGHAPEQEMTMRQATAHAENEFNKHRVAQRLARARAAAEERARVAAEERARAVAATAAPVIRKKVPIRKVAPSSETPVVSPGSPAPTAAAPVRPNAAVRANSAFSPDSDDDAKSVGGRIILPCTKVALSASAPAPRTPPVKCPLTSPPPVVRTLSYTPKPSVDTDTDESSDSSSDNDGYSTYSDY
jgi:hypothetical protein